eukprot:scaffold64_cov338-Pavlova_lutheri.AAC.26
MDWGGLFGAHSMAPTARMSRSECSWKWSRCNALSMPHTQCVLPLPGGPCTRVMGALGSLAHALMIASSWGGLNACCKCCTNSAVQGMFSSCIFLDALGFGCSKAGSSGMVLHLVNASLSRLATTRFPHFTSHVSWPGTAASMACFASNRFRCGHLSQISFPSASLDAAMSSRWDTKATATCAASDLAHCTASWTGGGALQSTTTCPSASSLDARRVGFRMQHRIRVSLAACSTARTRAWIHRRDEQASSNPLRIPWRASSTRSGANAFA